jgi:hypothetical protein
MDISCKSIFFYISCIGSLPEDYSSVYDIPVAMQGVFQELGLAA